MRTIIYVDYTRQPTIVSIREWLKLDLLEADRNQRLLLCTFYSFTFVSALLH